MAVPNQIEWSRIVLEARSNRCEDIRDVLVAWIRAAETAGTPTPDIWITVAKAFSLFVPLDLDAESPFGAPGAVDELERGQVLAIVESLDESTPLHARVRILDLAWQKRICDHKDATSVVRGYVELARSEFDAVAWTNTYSCLKRAVELSASLGRQESFTDAVRAVEETIRRAAPIERLFLVARLMSLLLHYDVGDEVAQANIAHEIAVDARAEYTRNGVANGTECEREREYLDLEIAWRKRMKQNEAVGKLNVEVAEAFARQAEGVVTAKWSAATLVAEEFIENAIERLRQTGGESDRITKLRVRLQQLQRESVGSMDRVEIPIDVTDDVRRAKAHVAGQPLAQALLHLALGHSPPTRAEVSTHAKERNSKNGLLALLPQTLIGPRGTTVARHGGSGENDDESASLAEEIRTAHELQANVAMRFVHPAAEQIREEHDVGSNFCSALARASGFVPDHHKRSFGRGIAAGFRGDFDLAATVLFPQFEHAIREVFAARGIVTATLPSRGSQNEFDLNRLFVLPSAVAVLGTELLFDLRALLTHKAGANLRNDLAHGILDDNAKIDAKIYFWWMCLRCALIPSHVLPSCTRRRD